MLKKMLRHFDKNDEALIKKYQATSITMTKCFN